MKLPKLFSSRVIITVVVTIIGLVAFNLTRPPLVNARLAAFDSWYTAAAPVLEGSSDAALANRKLAVKIRLVGGTAGSASNEWALPSQTLGNTEERQRLTRVLQLISESRVFGLTPLASPTDEAPHLALSIADGEQHFDTAVPLREVENDIRLQNLIKLLEVFSTQPISPPVDPARL
jgi:hypothetical protein